VSYDPADLHVGILEIFVERADCDHLLMAFMPSSRETKAAIEGFNFYKSADHERLFYDRRDAEQQRELDESAKVKRWQRAANASYYGRNVERLRAEARERMQQRHAQLTPEQREERRRKQREAKRKKSQQGKRLNEWRAKADAAKAKAAERESQKLRLAAGDAEATRAEKRRQQRVAQAQRRRDRMSEDRRRVESLSAGERRKRKANGE
jgi:hypothetical protein